ncbi:MAG: ATP-dependent Clp protease adaptor ClpS [Lachnospiraceae bacterium]|nr:ATP-dependent Clp protease adaptor ClpS [Lachnospiraceae bacterium]MCR5267544.1 ATP-dependent Clp protease adaptor ClpS [Lachnospiraceae bacterium]
MSVQNELREKTNDRIKEPAQYNVIMINDDFTTMDFVVMILIEIFKKDPATAEALMLTVHKAGRAVVGTYPYDVAVSKVSKALNRAKEQGFPFRMTVEEQP